MDRKKSAKLYLQKSRQVQHSYGKDLLKYANIQEGDHILDIGCGCGNITALIAKKVGAGGKVIGVDPDIDRIKLAKNNYSDVEFCACKSTNFPVNNSKPYDVIICNVVLHWIPTHEKVITFQRIMTALKSGGIFVGNISFKRSPNMLLATSLLTLEEQETIKKNYHRENYEKLKTLLLKAGFDIVIYEHRFKETSMRSPISFLEWLTGVYGGTYDFLTPYKENPTSISFEKNDNGDIRHTSEGITFVVRKPLTDLPQCV